MMEPQLHIGQEVRVRPGWRSCRLTGPATVASIYRSKTATGWAVRLRFPAPCERCGGFHTEVRLDAGWIEEAWPDAEL